MSAGEKKKKKNPGSVDSGGVEALVAFVEKGEALLEMAHRQSRGVSLQEFVGTKVRIEQKDSLLGLIDAAAELYASLSVKRRKDAEELWRENNHCAATQEALGAFQQLAVRWDSFLQHLDDELRHGSVPGPIADHPSAHISPRTSLADARTGEAVTLEKYLSPGKKILLVLIRQFSCLFCRLHLKELQKNQKSLGEQGVEVVVVSFGGQEGASHWIQETHCQYHVLLDPNRTIYAAFGLDASVKKVLSFSNMLRYAEYVADGVEFPRGLPTVQDDMFQLGGDFVIDDQGRALFCHRSQAPTDRPTVDQILAAL